MRPPRSLRAAPGWLTADIVRRVVAIAARPGPQQDEEPQPAAPLKRCRNRRRRRPCNLPVIPWPAEHQRALEIAFKRGISLSDLAPALERNFDAVAKHAITHGFRFGRRPRLAEPMDLDQLLALGDRKAAAPEFRRQEPRAKVRQPVDWSVERRQTFLATLEKTGSIAESLVAIGLKASSRKAAYREKHRDPVFSDQWDVALKISPFKPGPKGKGPSSHTKDWPQERRDKFIATYRETGLVAEAMRAVGASVGDAYKARSAFREFAIDWDQVKAEQKRKPRDGTWPKERRAEFIRHLSRRGKVAQALADMGMDGRDVSSVYLARKRFPDFVEQWDAALIAAAMRKAAIAEFAAGAARAFRQVARAENAQAKAAKAKAKKPQRPIEIATAPITARYVAPQLPPRPAPVVRASPDPVPPRPHPTRPATIEPRNPPTFAIPRRKTDAELAAESLRYIEERKRVAALSDEPGLSLHDAKLTLQRRGRSVYRMSVHGGSPELWYCSGLGKDITDEQLVAEARRVSA